MTSGADSMDLITERRVRELLRHLSRDRAPGSTALADLEIVKRSLARSGFQASRRARSFEISRLVTAIAENELARLRHQRVSNAPTHLVDEIDQIVVDFSQANRELEAWSALYYLYLRPDLDLCLQELSDLLSDRHRRTIQRRLQRGVAALTFRLQEMEYAAVADTQGDRLVKTLPSTAVGQLYGVESTVRTLGGLLSDDKGPGGVALAGPAGIGKTEIALHTARQLLVEGVFDGAIWLWHHGERKHKPASSSALSRALVAHLDCVPGDGNESVLVRLRHSPHLVVVDGVDCPAEAAAVSSRLLRAIGGGRLLLTGRIGWSGIVGVQSVRIRPLLRRDALSLLREEATQSGLAAVARSDRSQLEELVTATAGHPLAIRTAVSHLRMTSMATVADDFSRGTGVATQLLRHLWHAVWAASADEVQSVAKAAVSLAESVGFAEFNAVAAASGLGANAFSRALEATVECGLVEPGGDPNHRYLRPALFLGRYLQLLSTRSA